MVAVINPSKSLRNALNYNEQKLKQKKAVLIHSVNYGKDTEMLGFTDKIKRLEKLAALNENTKVNCVHISLNFDPSENLPVDTLRQIAEAYMQKIGFGDQPFLVYEHNDAGHPHIHILTTNIQQDGHRIELHNIGKNQSEKARKEIEIDFNLVKAQKDQLRQAYKIKPVNALKVQYGKSETKRAITNVLDAVLTTYKYASLPELNALLKGYNVLADRGSEGSRTYAAGGLVYRILDEHGQKVGVPVKASDIYSKPTLAVLKERFKANRLAKQPFKKRIKNAIDLVFLKDKPLGIDDFARALAKDNIQALIWRNEQGIMYGITYVDHGTKCVFNGRDIGPQYSSNAIQFRCSQQSSKDNPQSHRIVPKPEIHFSEKSTSNTRDTKDMLDMLVQPEQETAIPYELRKKQKRKRKYFRH